MPEYNELAECFRNVYKSDWNVNPSGTWTEAEMQAYLDRRDAQMAENAREGRDTFYGIGVQEPEELECLDCGLPTNVDDDGLCNLCSAEPEYDGQPDEAQEWHDFDPDC